MASEANPNRPTCECGSRRTRYVQTTVNCTSGGRCAAGWWVCFDCSRQFNGATDAEDGVLPPLVKRLIKREDDS